MRERMPPVPGANQIAYRILQKVKEIETPEYKECKAKSPHLPHVWARGRVEDRYWCPGNEAEIPAIDLVWEEREKDPAAVELGRKGGLKGGPARAAKMTPEERSESARHAAAALHKRRWDTSEVRDLIDEPVRTKEGWIQPSGPSRYFRPRRKR